MKIVQSVKSLSIHKFKNQSYTKVIDTIVIEQPLEIQLSYGTDKNRGYESIYTTMRTPGEDLHLAIGFLFSEGVIQSNEQINKIIPLEANKIQVELIPEIEYDSKKHQRNFISSASCGICGKVSIDDILNYKYEVINHSSIIDEDTLLSLFRKIEEGQTIFKKTGGLHSAALFDLNGKLLHLQEDVGRHNALDKLIGYMLEYEMTKTSHYILMLSGRIGYELVHKALKFGISIILAFGSPTSLSVEMAHKNNMCLIGFLKKDGFNIYSHPERLGVSS